MGKLGGIRIKMSDYDSLQDTLRRSMEISEKLANQVSPILEQQERLQRIIDSTSVKLPEIPVSSPAMDAIKEVVDNNTLKILSKNMEGIQTTTGPSATLTGISESVQKLTENHTLRALGEITPQLPNYTLIFKSPMLEQISSGITSFVQTFSNSMAATLAESTVSYIENIGSAIANAMQSPVIEWLQNIDLTPMYTALESLRVGGDILEQYKEFNKAYLTAMFECKWFPYAGWVADTSLSKEVSAVLATSRGASKRREKRIDKIILAYYTPRRIRDIKRSWKSANLESHIKKILGQAIEAHLRGEYALCISSLSTMWEGLIYIKANNVSMQDRQRQRMEVTKRELAELTESNDYDKIFSDYFDQFIVSQCNKVDDVVDGVPNRHGVSHSWYHSYPNKKASLNAILLTDFIIHLEPLEEERQENIQSAK